MSSSGGDLVPEMAMIGDAEEDEKGLWRRGIWIAVENILKV